MDAGDVLGPRADGHRRGGRAGRHRPQPWATASSSRSRSPAATASCATSGLQTQCETTQVREHGTGAALFGYTEAVRRRCPAARPSYLRVPQAQLHPIKVPDGPPDDRFVYLSDVLPTAWQAVEYADIPAGGTLVVLGPRPDRRHGLPHRRAPRARASSASTSSPSGWTASRARGRRGDRPREHDDDLADAIRELTDGRGADSVDRRRRHGGARLAGRRLAQKIAGAAARRDRRAADGAGRRRPARRAVLRDRHRPPRRHHLADRRLRRRRRPAADADALRQADPAAHGPGQRQALGRRHPAAAHRRRPARRRRFATHHLPARARRPPAYEKFQKKQDGMVKVVFKP